MPRTMKWVDAEHVLSHRGWAVYHAYAEDDLDQRADYYYMWDANGSFNQDAFDVRELPTYNSLTDDHGAAIRGYIDRMIQVVADLQVKYRGDLAYVEVDDGAVTLRFEGQPPLDVPEVINGVSVRIG